MLRKWLTLQEKRFSQYRYPRSLIFGLLVRVRVLTEFLVRQVVDPYRGEHKESLIRLRTEISGSPSLVLANGKSLDKITESEVELWKEESGGVVFAVNKFWRTSIGRTVVPDYLVLSDPLYHPKSESSLTAELHDYLKLHPSVKICIPHTWQKEARQYWSNEIFLFNDYSLETWSRNIVPFRPRGYTTGTAFKALSVAVYSSTRVFIIGFDNDFFRSLGADEQNRVFQLANHSASSATASSTEIERIRDNPMADYFWDLAKIFADLELCFSGYDITNLDKDSLVTCFRKGPLG